MLCLLFSKALEGGLAVNLEGFDLQKASHILFMERKKTDISILSPASEPVRFIYLYF